MSFPKQMLTIVTKIYLKFDNVKLNICANGFKIINHIL